MAWINLALAMFSGINFPTLSTVSILILGIRRFKYFKIKFNIFSFLVVIFFTIFLFLKYNYNELNLNNIKLFFSLYSQIIACIVIANSYVKYPNTFFKILFFYFIGLIIYLNYLSYLFISVIATEDVNRVILLSSESSLNGTSFGALCLLSSFSYYLFVCLDYKNIFLKIFLISSLVLYIIINFMLLNRLATTVLPIVLLIALYKKYGFYNLFVLVLIFSISVKDKFISLITESMFFERVTEMGFKTARWDSFSYFNELLTASFFGGNFVKSRYQISFLHNLFLDIFDSSGFIPFILFVLIFIIFYSKLFKNRNIINKFPLEFIYVFTFIIFLMAFFEPVFDISVHYANFIVLVFIFYNNHFKK
jgi:hypothetical protein|tara:strand:- start:9081 stop:10172 length:1092 start_codon:yes stop_codon:yes gene_type:complete